MNYDNETPMNDKFLMADGSIGNANGADCSECK